jgi:hypothetical protein
MDVGIHGWRLLRAGSGPGAVLSVDFTLAKVRAQANFGDLAPALPAEYPVWATDETSWPSSAGLAGEQVKAWLRTGTEVAAPVSGVLGFCASASLAGALAGRLAEAGGSTPPVVLFDPVTVGAQTLLDQFDAAMRRMRPSTGESAVPDPPTDLSALATLLADRYAATATEVCAGQGVPASIIDQLCRRVETNLRFLTLCATAGLGPRSADLLVLSREHEVPPPLRGVRAVRIDATQNELLAHPDAARATADVLAASLTGERS